MTQHVTEITRIDPVHGTENTLDLIMSNRPNSIISSSVLPGISDHDHPQIELDVQPVRNIKKPRNVPLYKKANWVDFSSLMDTQGEEIVNSPSDTNPAELWKRFRDAILEGIRKFIPHKPQKAKGGLPYITRDIKKLIRKRDWLYDKIKKASKNVSMHQSVATHKQRYKKLKAAVQSRIRQAYWAYIASVITPPDSDKPPQKSFWSFIKRNRTEKTQISSLRSQTTGDLITDPTGKVNIL